MGKCIERVFNKNSLQPNTASHNNTSWYTDTDGLLEHSPGGAACTKGAGPSEDNSILGGYPPSYVL